MPSAPQIFERLQRKYAIEEHRASAIREAIAPWVTPDVYNGRAGMAGYPICSLYLDTPALPFHRAKLRGASERFKLRIRTYGPHGPAHFEIKQKVNRVVRKLRTTVPRTDVRRAAQGGIPQDVRDHDAVTSRTLMDLKCETHVPMWLSRIIREHGLKRVGFSKHSTGVARFGLGGTQSQIVWRS